MRYYSQTTGCCYLTGIHTTMPEDAVEIPDDRYQAVIGNPEPGKVRSHDAHGLPILIDPPALTAEEVSSQERSWRDSELAANQWLRDRHRDEQDLGRATTLTEDQFVELLGYLQALRDWPQSESFPDLTFRPVAPGWIAEQHL
ncbi:phage tail assembly chaperone [Pseudomonas juntendi]|uniref:phage tail assembly chaperone n=1 Tax=Pseudomonas juntendi TaxID=2666183 RepID=UPI0032096CB9